MTLLVNLFVCLQREFIVLNCENYVTEIQQLINAWTMLLCRFYTRENGFLERLSFFLSPFAFIWGQLLLLLLLCSKCTFNVFVCQRRKELIALYLARGRIDPYTVMDVLGTSYYMHSQLLAGKDNHMNECAELYRYQKMMIYLEFRKKQSHILFDSS